MINSVAPATPATRLRLTYRISSGSVSGQSGATQAAQAITDFLNSEAVQGYVVSNATTPVEGAGSGQGALGILDSLTGRHDWFSTVDVLTNYDLPSMAWGDFLAPAQSVPLGLLGLDVTVTLDSTDIVSRTDPEQVAPSAQSHTTSTAALASIAGSPVQSLKIGGIGVAAVVLVALGLIVFIKVAK